MASPRPRYAVVLSLLFANSFWYSLALANQHRSHIVEGIQLVHRSQENATSPFAVLGIESTGNGTVHPRLEIRELERRPDDFNVFLLGLQRFQSIDQNDKLSYYQIAGIHGVPFTSWDGVQSNKSNEEGYCRHSSNLFPTWHRPYLALVEQMIYQNAQNVISEFADGELKRRMNFALHTFRLPYWDAAAVPPVGEGSYPGCVQHETIEVEVCTGNGSVKTLIDNPLYSYKFHPLPGDDFDIDDPFSTFGSSDRNQKRSVAGKSRWLQWTSTMRSPTAYNASAKSQNNLVAAELDRNVENQRQRTYQMLAMQHDYYNVSNNRAHGGTGMVADSLESVHDTLHNTVGNNGHMWKTQYAAFDPIFWLLHANTDRMLAIWQGLHPDSYVTNRSDSRATFTTPPYSWTDENTPLHPFHSNEAGDFWTSSSVRDHKVFGYTYPELIDLHDNTTLINRVNALYGPGAMSQFSWDAVQRPGSADASPQLDVTQHYYFANVRATSGVPNVGYKVYVFFVDIPEDSQASGPGEVDVNGPGLVGFTGFQNTVNTARELTQTSDGKTTGVIALTKALEDKVRVGRLASMDEMAVTAYLQRTMTWRVALANDQLLPADDANGIEVEVLWAKVTPPTPDSCPKFQSNGFQLLMRATGAAGAEAWDMS